MKAVKLVLILVVAYAAVVAAFESMIGILQPEPGGTLVITTLDANGSPHGRVVSRLESNGQLYVAANHWPRAWYRRALERPEVQVAIDGQTSERVAVPVGGEEHARVDAANPLGLWFRILTGFPPRYFLRLDPPAMPGAPR
jgi:hypothetical protein